MTPTRLRELALLIESQCIELRTLKKMKERIPCDLCSGAARDLRELANEWADDGLARTIARKNDAEKCAGNVQ